MVTVQEVLDDEIRLVYADLLNAVDGTEWPETFPEPIINDLKQIAIEGLGIGPYLQDNVELQFDDEKECRDYITNYVLGDQYERALQLVKTNYNLKENNMKKPNRQALREDAEEFVVLIAMKGPDGVTYDSIGYADEETDINYEEGIYGYDADVRENVHAMTRDTATKLAAEIVENAPAGDLLVGVVPYSTIPSEGSEGFSAESSTEDFTDDGESAEADEFDDSEVVEEEGSEEDEGSEEEAEEDESEDKVEESIRRAQRTAAAIRERVLGRNKLREDEDDEDGDSDEGNDEVSDDVIENIASEVYNSYSDDMFTKLESELDVDDIKGPEDEQDYEELCADIKAWAKDESEIDLDEDAASIAEVYMQSQNFEDFFQDRLQYWMDTNESDDE